MTFVCLGTGPSLTAGDVNYCRGRARIIAINSAYKLALWADALYSCDMKWWVWHNGAPEFTGRKFRLETAARYPQSLPPDITVLRNTGESGLELDPTGLRTGRNSGYQGINLSVHLGAKRILLLGYDMKAGIAPRHHAVEIGEHPDNSYPPYRAAIPLFATLVEPLKAIGVECINCTPGSAITAFPTASLGEVLREVAA